jgi:hypothetical protein
MLPERLKGGWWEPTAAAIISQQEVHSQPRSWTGGNCCPDVGEPLPDRRGRRAREEDVRQSGELLLAGAMGAQVGGCTAPVDVALEGAHKEPAMKEVLSCDPGGPVQVRAADDLPH